MLALICKARGVKLGNPPMGLRRSGALARALWHCVRRSCAMSGSTLRIWRRVVDIRAAGAVSLRAIAGGLNARGMLTRRGGQWQVSNVRNLLERLS